MVMAATDCFRCCPGPGAARAPEAPWSWSEPRALCYSHKTFLKVEDGQLLEEVLDRAAPADHPLEGSLLAWVFNPVFFEVSDGRRIWGWTDFVAGGMAVYEDRFVAKSYFEFRAFETARAVDLLYTLHSAALSGASVVTLPEVIRVVVTGTTTMPPHARSPFRGPAEGLVELIRAWNFQRHLQRLRTSHGRLWPESFTELTSWMKTCTEDGEALESDTESSFVRALGELVMRRFSPMARRGP
jgi:hypothetical protein